MHVSQMRLLLAAAAFVTATCGHSQVPDASPNTPTAVALDNEQALQAFLAELDGLGPNTSPERLGFALDVGRCGQALDPRCPSVATLNARITARALEVSLRSAIERGLIQDQQLLELSSELTARLATWTQVAQQVLPLEVQPTCPCPPQSIE